MIKVEVIGDDETLLPDPFETYEACKVLLEKGYIVCPYISNDVVLETFRRIRCSCCYATCFSNWYWTWY